MTWFGQRIENPVPFCRRMSMPCRSINLLMNALTVYVQMNTVCALRSNGNKSVNIHYAILLITYRWPVLDFLRESTMLLPICCCFISFFYLLLFPFSLRLTLRPSTAIDLNLYEIRTFKLSVMYVVERLEHTQKILELLLCSVDLCPEWEKYQLSITRTRTTIF